ncbi:hypothetical protein T439DRAFT_384122 [Meredithblackwellia eburnea MCA 4105]
MMGAENSPLYPGYPYSKYDTITGLESAQYLADYLIAPPLAGWMVHGILYGSLISEMNRYRTSTSFKASSREKKVLIWVIVGLESINMSMSFGQSMHYGTTQDRTTLNLLTGSFSLDSASFLLGGLIAMLVQMTLARRCASLFLWREKERKLFQVVVFTLSVMAFMAVFSVFVLYALYLNNLSVQNGGYLTNILTSVWAFLSAAVDTTITISLVLILRKQVQGFNPEVDDVVTKIIKLGLETGAATTVGAILCAILSLVFPADDLRGANLADAALYPGWPYTEYDTRVNMTESSQDLADFLIAPPLAGWMVHGILFGWLLSSFNTFRASSSFKASSRERKIIIWAIVWLEAVNMCMSFGQSMHYGTTQNRTTLNLITGSFSLDSASFLLGGLIALLVQVTLARRCASLFLWRDKEKIIFQLLVFSTAGLAFVSLFCVFLLYVLYLNNRSVHNGGYLTNILTSIWAFLSAGVDVTITVSLILILRKQRRGFNPEVDDVLTNIMKLGLETGSLTAVSSILCAVLSLIFPPSDIRGANIGTSVSYAIPALYILSLLATLQIQSCRESRAPVGVLPPAVLPSFVSMPRTKKPKDVEEGAVDPFKQMEALEVCSLAGPGRGPCS